MMDWQHRLAERREVFQKGPPCNLTELTKPGSVSFGSEQDGHFQNIEPRDEALINRCKTACRNLPLWPAELLTAMTEEDKQAQLDGSEGPETLRAFAESLSARLRTNTLPPGIPEAYERLRRQLAEHPGLRVAAELLAEDGATGNRLLAVAIRGRGCITLRVSPERMDEGRLLEIVARWNGEA